MRLGCYWIVEGFGFGFGFGLADLCYVWWNWDWIFCKFGRCLLRAKHPNSGKLLLEFCVIFLMKIIVVL